MPLLNKPGQPAINFVHIPRTGGRFVVELLLANGFSFLHGHTHPLHFSNVVDGFEVMHFHQALVKRHFGEARQNEFTVVRDPIERLLSGSSRLLEFAESKGLTPLLRSERIFEVLAAAQEISCNWFRPQSEFISDRTSVWRYSDGLEQDFISWVSSCVDDKLTRLPSSYMRVSADGGPRIILSEEALLAVKRFYSSDYDLLSNLAER